MEKIDLKKELRHLFNPSKDEVQIVNVPGFNFLMIDGAGDPGKSKEFQTDVELLYGISYTIKFDMKKTGKDYIVMPLEGLWWADDLNSFAEGKKENWKWTVMIMQPSFVGKEEINSGMEKFALKKKMDTSRVRTEKYAEGPSVQLMHMGTYANEGPSIRKLHNYIGEHGYAFNGKHHEIYLSDPKKTIPDKIKTILRQGVTGKV